MAQKRGIQVKKAKTQPRIAPTPTQQPSWVPGSQSTYTEIETPINPALFLNLVAKCGKPRAPEPETALGGSVTVTGAAREES